MIIPTINGAQENWNSMKNTLTRDEYDLLTFLKSAHDQLDRLSNRFYYYAKKVLEVEDDDWITDYFNDDISVTELLTHMNIDIKEKEE